MHKQCNWYVLPVHEEEACAGEQKHQPEPHHKVHLVVDDVHGQETHVRVGLNHKKV